ncbi:type I-F CRISPR-associated protein Cas7f/Csy3 [Thiomicrorhabdus indica]|uniref:type I-F CRISPR-associated protein Cas7f/Csy3 n=1 Tax=Thiomicrorhabdus indica TaxID=2267253 RepID=UPI0013EE41FB|nr:type I-F CRISPR-associated protein Cas7f/Csy3 [Thiomicrorhabdus indica]
MAKKLPTLLSLTGAIDPSHALMFGSSGFDGELIPLEIQQRSVLGTLGAHAELKKIEEKTKKGDPVSPDGNPQTVDGCFLDYEQDTLHVKGTIRIVNMIDAINCNDGEVLALLKSYYLADEQTPYFEEIAKRTLIQFVKGAPLHRNGRAKNIQLSLKTETLSMDLAVNPRLDFSADLAELHAQLPVLSETLVQALQGGVEEIVLLKYHYRIELGEGQEVYPSEEFVDGSSDKTLFRVRGNQAGMHTQKIGNGLRTIDTWYEDNAMHAIPVDPYGPDKRFGCLRRAKNHVFDALSKLINEKPMDSNEQHYLIASMIRGGVYSAK